MTLKDNLCVLTLYDALTITKMLRASLRLAMLLVFEVDSFILLKTCNLSIQIT